MLNDSGSRVEKIASGGTSGIILNTTGSTGDFTVNGGTIQNTTGDGISLNAVTDVVALEVYWAELDGGDIVRRDSGGVRRHEHDTDCEAANG